MKRHFNGNEFLKQCFPSLTTKSVPDECTVLVKYRKLEENNKQRELGKTVTPHNNNIFHFCVTI